MTTVKWFELVAQLDPLLNICTKTVGETTEKVLFIDGNGHPCITNEGAIILNHLKLTNEVARLLKNAATEHHAVFGDSSKSFIILAVSCLKQAHCIEDVDSQFGRGRTVAALEWFLRNVLHSTTFLKRVLEASSSLSLSTSDEERMRGTVKELVSSSLRGVFATPAVTKLADLLTCFVCKAIGGKVDGEVSDVLGDLRRSFDRFVVSVTGVPLCESLVVDGMLLERRAAFASEIKLPALLKGLVVDLDRDSDSVANAEMILDHSKSEVLSSACLIKKWVSYLRDDAIDCVYCAGKLDSVLALYCERFGIVIFDQLGVDFVEGLCASFAVGPVEMLALDFESDSFKVEVSELTFANRDFFCLKRPSSSEQSLHTIVLCSVSAQMHKQYARALHNCLKVLGQWADPSNELSGSKTLYTIDANSFALLLHALFEEEPNELAAQILVDSSIRDRSNLEVASKIISKALFALIKSVHDNSADSRGRLVEKMLAFRKFFKQNGTVEGWRFFNADHPCTTPAFSLIMLLCNVVKVVLQVLSIDQILSKRSSC